MKHKKLSILTAIGAMFAVALAPLANVSAWTVSPAEGNGSIVTIKREIKNASTIVTNTFTYSISAASTGNPAAVSGYPTSAQIAFTNAAPTDNTVVGSADIDFSTAVFNKVGDYTFIISETGTTDATSFPLSAKTYEVVISVRNETNNGVPTGNHVATLGAVTLTGASTKLSTIQGANSLVIFDASVVRTYVTVKKQVTGNNADEDLCFAIQVTFTGNANVGYSLSGSSCPDQPASVDGNGSTIIFLKHNETATIGKSGSISEIPIGATFKVVEQGATDYETFIDGSTTNSKTSAIKTVAAIDSDTFDATNRITVVNNKETAPRTGVIFSVLPFIIIALIGIFGAAYVAKTKKVTE